MTTDTQTQTATNGAAAPQTAVAVRENTQIGLTTSSGFELAQRAAKALSASTLVPKEYQNNLPNCLVALNMANRIGADPLMVMQNLYVVHGRPGWSSQFLIGTFNTCGRFSAMRFEFRSEQGKDDWGCRAWAIEKETGEKIYGSWVDIALAKKEGWSTKSGSKWQTMPQQMLMYRAASFFVRVYAPELAQGLQTREENEDVLLDATHNGGGTYEVTESGMPSVIQTLNEKLHGEKPPVIDAETGEVVDDPRTLPDGSKVPETHPDRPVGPKPTKRPGQKSCQTCVGSGVVYDGDTKGPCPDCQ